MMGRLRAMREPLKYVQGRDALLKFQEEMGYMGKRWLFVCSNSGYKACHDKIEKSFGTLDDYRRYEIFGGISSKGEIAKMEAIVKEDKIDTVVAVGGGSAVDTAKATAYYTGKHIVILPTVAATDAPCTGLSVIYNDDHSFDKYLFYPTNPDAVMVDTTVIANAPVKFLIAGMGDALGTYFEGRASIRTESLPASRARASLVQVRRSQDFATIPFASTASRLLKLAKFTPLPPPSKISSRLTFISRALALITSTAPLHTLSTMALHRWASSTPTMAAA